MAIDAIGAFLDGVTSIFEICIELLEAALKKLGVSEGRVRVISKITALLSLILILLFLILLYRLN
jgi:hypothetical protein